MPKHRRAPKVIKTNRDIIQRQFSCLQRGKENSRKSIEDSTNNDPILTYMKVEVKQEELDTTQSLELSDELNIPLKIEQFETLEYDSIKQENSEPVDTITQNNSKDLNILIEWALNLQFEHSKRCTGRLYPCKDIYDNFRCKIVVLYCTVCKKRMLHALKDWGTF